MFIKSFDVLLLMRDNRKQVIVFVLHGKIRVVGLSSACPMQQTLHCLNWLNSVC